MYGELTVFTGNANPALAQAVCAHLRVPLGDADVFEFSNENIFVKLNNVVREQDVFIIQSMSSPVNRSIMELFIMLDTVKRASAARITAVVPYFAYGRSDKKDQARVPITARLLANLIERAGAQRVVTMDLHAGQIQGFFDVPCDELTATAMLTDYFQSLHLHHPVVVSPDLGFAKRARNFADRLHCPLAIVEKRRLGDDSRTEVLGLIGDVRGRSAIIIDDEIDTAGSITNAVRTVKEHGAYEIRAACVHPVLSGPAIERLRAAPIVEMITTDTVPLPDEKRLDKIRVLSVAPILAAAIERIHSGGSIGALFR